MRRTIAFIALWFVAGAAAATVAWLGVSTVSDQLAGSGSHPDPLSADEIAAEAAAASDTTSTTVGSDPTATSTTSTTVPPDGAGAVTTTTLGRPSTTPTTPPVPPTTSAPQPAPVVRSYDLVGGSTTLRFTASGVTVVVATPKPGFTADVGESRSGGARVEFESEGHRSRVDGWWDGGPQDEVREDG